MATILIVDDNLANRQFLVMLLGYGDYHLLEAGDGAAALKIARAEQPDLIISDVVMPTMDGFEFVRQLRRVPALSHTPVIFYTAAFEEREARGLADAVGVPHILPKPSEAEVILQTVREVLRNPQTAVPTTAEMIDEQFGQEHRRRLTDKLAAQVTALEGEIAERERAEKELRDSQARLAGVVNSAMDAIITIDDDQRVVLFNPAAVQMFGYGSAEIIGQRIDRLIPQRFRAAHREHVRAFGQTGTTNRRMGALGAISGLRANGEEFPIEASISQVEVAGHKLYTVILRDITARQRAEEELATSSQQLRALARRVESVQEEQRGNIARELHDELGQALSVLKINLSVLGKELQQPDGAPSSAALQGRIEPMVQIIEGALQSVRRICLELRPRVLDDLGLAAAIEWQVGEFQKHAGIRCRIAAPPDQVTLNREQSTAVFRILQEALTNVARHAGASRVAVSLREEAGSEASHLLLEVRDNGRGITADDMAKTTSLGLLGMRERALLLGGEVTVQGSAGKGTTVRVRIPLRQAETN